MSDYATLKNGTCCKCGSNEIYVNSHAWNQRGGFKSNTIPITSITSAKLKNYVCADCGYTESYVWKPSKRKKISRKWTKVNHA